MAFKLTKDEKAERDRLIKELRARATAIADAVTDYNEVLSEATDFAAGISVRADDEISEKSERWQEGEKGAAAASWRDGWDNIDLDEVDAPDTEHADNLENVPEVAE
jgi:hypothetical protein